MQLREPQLRIVLSLLQACDTLGKRLLLLRRQLVDLFGSQVHHVHALLDDNTARGSCQTKHLTCLEIELRDCRQRSSSLLLLLLLLLL